jgi:hypothetical protein
MASISITSFHAAEKFSNTVTTNNSLHARDEYKIQENKRTCIFKAHMKSAAVRH